MATAWLEIEAIDAELGRDQFTEAQRFGTTTALRQHRMALFQRRLQLSARHATRPGEFAGDLRKRAAAFHEAGHAWMGLACKIPIKGAWIGPARDLTVGDGWTEYVDTGLGITERALTIAAGPAAEKLFTGANRGQRGDEANFDKLLAELPADERDEFEAEMVRDAAAWVRDEAAEIQTVAEALLERGELSADDLLELLPWARFHSRSA